MKFQDPNSTDVSPKKAKGRVKKEKGESSGSFLKNLGSLDVSASRSFNTKKIVWTTIGVTTAFMIVSLIGTSLINNPRSLFLSRLEALSKADKVASKYQLDIKNDMSSDYYLSTIVPESIKVSGTWLKDGDKELSSYKYNGSTFKFLTYKGNYYTTKSVLKPYAKLLYGSSMYALLEQELSNQKEWVDLESLLKLFVKEKDAKNYIKELKLSKNNEIVSEYVGEVLKKLDKKQFARYGEDVELSLEADETRSFVIGLIDHLVKSKDYKGDKDSLKELKKQIKANKKVYVTIDIRLGKEVGDMEFNANVEQDGFKSTIVLDFDKIDDKGVDKPNKVLSYEQLRAFAEEAKLLPEQVGLINGETHDWHDEGHSMDDGHNHSEEELAALVNEEVSGTPQDSSSEVSSEAPVEGQSSEAPAS